MAFLVRRSLPLLRSRLPLTISNRHLITCFSPLESSRSDSSAATRKPPSPPPQTPETPFCTVINGSLAMARSDIDYIMSFAKQILHSNRYIDGECLCPDDEEEVVKRLLAYHPQSEDKIGCGLNSIMVDRHPEYRGSRCLFVVRTDGDCIDFSYRKCLRAYIQEKYPSYAETLLKKIC